MELAAWNGVVPATAALAIGIATRRWLPKNLFVYILARAFLGTALAMWFAGALRVWWMPRLPGRGAVTLERSFLAPNHLAAAIIAFRKVRLTINTIHG